MMRKTIISAFAIVVMLLAAGAPVFESTALAATKKRACSCSKPTLRRRARRAVVHSPRTTATNPNAYAAQGSPNAQVIGPVTATYKLEANQYFRLLIKGNDAELRSGTEVGMTTTRPMTFTIRSER